MTDLHNLPPSTTPAEFLQLIQDAVKDQPAPENASADKAQITLTGDGGGEWTMGFVDGRLQFTEGTTESPAVAVSLTVDDWRAFMLGSVADAVKGEVGTAALDPSMIGELYKNADKVEALKAMPGTLALVVTDGDAAHKVTIAIGGARLDVDNPQATVNVALENFVPLLAGKEDPTQAFFGGKLTIEGDVNIVMMLGMQLMQS